MILKISKRYYLCGTIALKTMQRRNCDLNNNFYPLRGCPPIHLGFYRVASQGVFL